MALLDITFIFAVPLLFLYFMLFHVVSINFDQFIPFVDNDTFINFYSFTVFYSAGILFSICFFLRSNLSLVKRGGAQEESAQGNKSVESEPSGFFQSLKIYLLNVLSIFLLSLFFTNVIKFFDWPNLVAMFFIMIAAIKIADEIRLKYGIKSWWGHLSF